MTYDEHSKKLVVVEGLVNGAEPPLRHWEFWLRPGLGNAGACFKRGRSMVYLRDQTTIETDYYVPWDTEYGVLVSTPVDHPELERYVRGPVWQVAPELPRQIVAIVNIGSTCTASTLRRLKDKAEQDTLDAVESGAAFVVKAILQLLARVPLTPPGNDGSLSGGKAEKGEESRQTER